MAQVADERSSTFTRLRVELILTSLLILAVSRLSINLGRIPGIGLDMQSGESIPSGSLLLVLLSFYIYCLIAFIVRYKIENGQMASPSQIYQKEIAELKKTAEQVRAWNVRDARIELDQLLGAFSNDVERFSALVGTLDEKLSSHKGILSSKLPEQALEQTRSAVAIAMHYYKDKIDPSYTGQIADQIVKQIMEETVQNRIIAEQAIISVSDEAKWLSEEVKGSGQLGKFFSQHERKMAELIEAQTTKVSREVRLLNFEIRKLQQSVDGFATIVAFDRNGLSFWVPLASSILIVVYSLAFSLADAVEALKYIFPSTGTPTQG